MIKERAAALLVRHLETSALTGQGYLLPHFAITAFWNLSDSDQPCLRAGEKSPRGGAGDKRLPCSQGTLLARVLLVQIGLSISGRLYI